MELSEYTRCDATELRRLIERGAVSADEVRAVALRAIEAVDARVGAVVDGPYEDAPAPALDGPLGGVPFALKDTLPDAGRPLGFGTRLLEGVPAPRDATLTRRFRAAGLVNLARSAAPEFGSNVDTAPVVHGPTRNPWDLGRSPGGSSGGAAALVAARALPLAHANDGAGSIRIPAAWTGLVGLKPSRGRVPLGPAVGEAFGGLAHEFAVTRTVRDAALLLDAVCGPSPGDRYYVERPAIPFAESMRREPRGLRIAVQAESPGGRPTEPAVRAAVERTARTLEDLGHHVEPGFPSIDPGRLRRCVDTLWTLDLAGMAAAFGALSGREPGPDTVEAASWGCIVHGRSHSGADVAAAGSLLNRISRTAGAFLEDFDVLVCPTTPTTAPPSGTPAMDDERYAEPGTWFEALFELIPFTPLANVSGQPSISLPLGTDDAGLPVGVMLTAQTLREDVLLGLAAQLEGTLPWADRVPPTAAGA